MLISKEMEGKGILRITRANHEFVYCLKDLCNLLGIKSSNKLRSELDAKEMFQLPIYESSRHQNAIFVGMPNLNKVFNSAENQSNATLVAEWFAKEVFPLTVKGDEYSYENLEDPAVRMSLLSDYEDLKFKVTQLEIQKRKDKPYLDSMLEILGSKNAISLNVYYDEIFERGFPKGKFYAMLRSIGVLDDSNQVTQEYLDNVRFKKVTTVTVVCDKKITTDVVFVTKSGINLIEQLLNSYEGDNKLYERDKG